jgi:NAD(P)-dependent dehydrogenase (short-subunit alcohol dehydrogenase family)
MTRIAGSKILYDGTRIDSPGLVKDLNDMTETAHEPLRADVFRDPLTLFQVADRSALVTGASGAFGRGIALALGALGANLTLASGSSEEVQELAGRINAADGVAQALARRPDSLEDAQAMIDAAVSAYGKVELLVVASGHNQAEFIQDMSVEDWERVMDANVRGAWLMAKAFGTHVITSGHRGKVLLMSSVRGRHGNYSGYTAYCTSKGATDALTRALATEWGRHGITVNAIAPTVFRSKLTEWMFGEDERGRATRERSLSRIPLGRLAEVQDLIGMAIYLLSPASDFCTGQVMYIDGGYTAG